MRARACTGLHKPYQPNRRCGAPCARVSADGAAAAGPVGAHNPQWNGKAKTYDLRTPILAAGRGLSRGSTDSNTLAPCAQAAGARGTSRSPAHASDDFDAFETVRTPRETSSSESCRDERVSTQSGEKIFAKVITCFLKLQLNRGTIAVRNPGAISAMSCA